MPGLAALIALHHLLESVSDVVVLAHLRERGAQKSGVERGDRVRGALVALHRLPGPADSAIDGPTETIEIHKPVFTDGVEVALR